MLMILLSAASVIEFRICGNGYSWPLNLNLTFGKVFYIIALPNEIVVM